MLSQVTNHGPSPIIVYNRDRSTVVLDPGEAAICDPLTIDCQHGPSHWSLGPADNHSPAEP